MKVIRAYAVVQWNFFLEELGRNSIVPRLISPDNLHISVFQTGRESLHSQTRRKKVANDKVSII